MKFLGRYSNGWGHLVVTITSLIFCVVLLLVIQDETGKGIVISMVTAMIGYWFGGKTTKESKENTKEDKEKDERDS